MNWNDLAILLILVVLVVILAFIRPVFLTPNNLLNIMRQVSIVAILGIGMTYVLISAEIDLSVGSLVALSGVVVAMMLKSGVPIPISILAGILTDSFKTFGRGYLAFIPIPVVIMAVCYIFGHSVLKYTKFGRSIFAIGGNIEAAKLSGIQVARNKVLIHTISGLTAGIAGVVLASRLFSGQPSAGNGLELDAIAACVIGGTSTSGGKGRLWGTLLGAVIMGIITNGMNLLSISTNWQYVMQGVIIIIAVGLDRIKSND